MLESLDAVAKPVVKLNYPVLGKRMRGQVKELQAAVDAGEYEILDDGPRLRIGSHCSNPRTSRFTTRRLARARASRPTDASSSSSI